MKKTIALLAALLLVVGTSIALMLPASAAAATAVTWTGEDGKAVELKSGDTAENGKVKFENGVLTLDGVKGQSIKYQAGDLTIVVKGEVTLIKPDTSDKVSTVEMEAGSALTVRTEKNSVLNIGDTGYYGLTMRGNVTFEGAGTVNIKGGQKAIWTLPSGDITLTVADSAVVNVSGKDNVIGDTDAGHPDNLFKVVVKGHGALNVTASNQYPFRYVSDAQGKGMAVTVEDQGTITLTTSSKSMFHSTTPTTITNGNGTKLIVKAGTSKDDAKPVEGYASASEDYQYVSFSVEGAPEAPTGTDTSASTNTGSGNPSTSESSLWMVGTLATLAVAAVAGTAILSLRKKKN